MRRHTRQALMLRDLALGCLEANVDTGRLQIQYKPANGDKPHQLELFLSGHTPARVFAVVWLDDVGTIVPTYVVGNWVRALRRAVLRSSER
jgi:hypothetical protein